MTQSIPQPAGQPVTKLSMVRAAMAAGDFRKATSIAARFQDLGNERAAILDAHTAYTNPRFVRQVGKDPDALIEAGRAALIARYIPRAECQGGAGRPRPPCGALNAGMGSQRTVGYFPRRFFVTPQWLHL